jgi:hypothetical protein
MGTCNCRNWNKKNENDISLENKEIADGEIHEQYPTPKKAQLLTTTYDRRATCGNGAEHYLQVATYNKADMCGGMKVTTYEHNVYIEGSMYDNGLDHAKTTEKRKDTPVANNKLSQDIFDILNNMRMNPADFTGKAQKYISMNVYLFLDVFNVLNSLGDYSFDPILWSEIMYSKIYNLLKSEGNLTGLYTKKFNDCDIIERKYDQDSDAEAILFELLDSNVENVYKLITQTYTVGCVFCYQGNIVVYFSNK